jgi:hypothetical protein
MGPALTALLKLQLVEKDLSQLKRRRRSRQNAVRAQEARIDKHQQEYDQIKQDELQHRKQADEYDLRLRESEEHINKYRQDLNAAKTNKEYASILTQINSFKADNAKVEEEALKIMGEVDGLRAQAQAIEELINKEKARLEEIKAGSADEIQKLDTMIAELEAKRQSAAADVPDEALAAFDRLAQQYDGEAMAKVEVTGKRPPYDYTCGGCFMSLNAEHANALRSRDEVRQCDNCRRILYIEDDKA